jgi:hypothetical protein
MLEMTYSNITHKYFSYMKVKVKFALEQAMKAQIAKGRYSSTPSISTALDGVSG